MTKAELEALKNSLLASGQPINSAGMHRPMVQALINELYLAQSRGDVLKDVQQSLAAQDNDVALVIRSNQAYLVPIRTSIPGALVICSVAYDASGDSYPATGGTGTGGTILKGNIFITNGAGTEDPFNIPGSWLIALVDSPGSTSANWHKLYPST